MEKIIQPVQQDLAFTMIISIGFCLIPCDVYNARQADNTTFTRVIMYPAVAASEQVIDVYRGEHGWMNMYTGEESPWSAMIAPALSYHVQQESKD